MDLDILCYCETGNLSEIERCLDLGVSPNFQSNEGESPLHVAAANGYSNLAALLINKGALIDITNNYGWTPLMYAARYGHITTVSLLLKLKAKVNVCNKLGISAMVAAACFGSLPVVKLLFEAGAIIDHMSSGYGTNQCDLSTVMAASLYGHRIILEYLIKNGAEIDNASSITGLTPLMLAACNGHKEIVSLLIENEADFSKKDLWGRTALNLSCIFNQLDVKMYLESLIASKSKSSSSMVDIFESIKIGDAMKVKSVLERNPDSAKIVNLHEGLSPLILASILGYSNIASLLISFGAPLDVQDIENGWTAIMHAVSNGHSDLVRLLLDAGADANICALNGYTALDLAQHNENNDPAIIEMITSRFVTREFKNSIVSPECTNQGRLSASDRYATKRSLSQTRVKEWIGGVAHHLQNKMLTRRSAKTSENIPSIEITLTDEAANEVFLEQTIPPKESNNEKLNEPVMLPPDLYLANALKEHKVEAIIPPFPHISSECRSTTKDIQKKFFNDKNSKTCATFLHLPHLLKNYSRKKILENSMEEKREKASISNNRKISNEIEVQTKQEINISTYVDIKSEPIKLESASTSSKSYQSDLTVLLNKESLQKYLETFREQEIDIETFQHLTEEDLNEIGIQNTESQKKLMDIIKNLQT